MSPVSFQKLSVVLTFCSSPSPQMLQKAVLLIAQILHTTFDVVGIYAIISVASLNSKEIPAVLRLFFLLSQRVDLC